MKIGELDTASGKGEHLLTFAAHIGDGRLEQSLSLGGGKVAFVQSSYASAPEVYAGTLAGPVRAITHYNDDLKPLWGKSYFPFLEERWLFGTRLAAVSCSL